METTLEATSNFQARKEQRTRSFRCCWSNKLTRNVIPSTVGHIPLELSRYIWYALERGASVNAEVKSVKYKPSPLVQGGLEIPIEVTVRWAHERGLQILKEKVDSVRYPVGDEESYIDDSREILRLILPNDVQIIASDSDSEQSNEQSDCISEQSNEQSDCDSEQSDCDSEQSNEQSDCNSEQSNEQSDCDSALSEE